MRYLTLLIVCCALGWLLAAIEWWELSPRYRTKTAAAAVTAFVALHILYFMEAPG